MVSRRRPKHSVEKDSHRWVQVHDLKNYNQKVTIYKDASTGLSIRVMLLETGQKRGDLAKSSLYWFGFSADPVLPIATRRCCLDSVNNTTGSSTRKERLL